MDVEDVQVPLEAGERGRGEHEIQQAYGVLAMVRRGRVGGFLRQLDGLLRALPGLFGGAVQETHESFHEGAAV